MAAKKFYFPLTTAAPYEPPSPGTGWNEVETSLITRALVRTAGSSTLTSVASTNVCGAGDHIADYNHCHRAYVYGPLAAQTILQATTVRGQFQTLEGNAGNNLFITMKLYTMSSAGALKSLLLAATRKGTEPTTSLRNTTFAATALAGSGADVTVALGDYLVVEVGLGGLPVAVSGTQNHNGSIRWGETASGGDLPVDETSALTTLRPWIEFSADIAPAIIATVVQDTETDVAPALVAQLHGAAWDAALNTTEDIDVSAANVKKRLRIGIENSGTAIGASAFKIRCSRNSGAYFDVTASSTYVKTYDSTFFADGDDVPQLITSGTYQTDNNAAEESTGAFTLTAGLAAATKFEMEVALEFIKADLADNDSLDFRITQFDGTVLDTYTATANITITNVAALTVAITQDTEIDESIAFHLALKRVANQVTESDLSQALARLHARALTQDTETDQGIALGRPIHLRALIQDTETDQTFAVGKLKTKSINQIAELDLSQSLTTKKLLSIAQDTETDQSLALTRIKLRSVTLLNETDLARAFTKLKNLGLSVSMETDLSQTVVKALTGRQITLVISTELDETFAVLVNPIHRLVSQASENDLSQLLGRLKTLILVRPIEQDESETLSRLKQLGLFLDEEIDLGVAVGRRKDKVIDLAESIEEALAVLHPAPPQYIVLDDSEEIDEVGALSSAKAKDINLVSDKEKACSLTALLWSDLGGSRRRHGVFYYGHKGKMGI